MAGFFSVSLDMDTTMETSPDWTGGPLILVPAARRMNMAILDVRMSVARPMCEPM